MSFLNLNEEQQKDIKRRKEQFIKDAKAQELDEWFPCLSEGLEGDLRQAQTLINQLVRDFDQSRSCGNNGTFDPLNSSIRINRIIDNLRSFQECNEKLLLIEKINRQVELRSMMFVQEETDKILDRK